MTELNQPIASEDVAIGAAAELAAFVRRYGAARRLNRLEDGTPFTAQSFTNELEAASVFFCGLPIMADKLRQFLGGDESALNAIVSHSDPASEEDVEFDDVLWLHDLAGLDSCEIALVYLGCCVEAGRAVSDDIDRMLAEATDDEGGFRYQAQA